MNVSDHATSQWEAYAAREEARESAYRAAQRDLMANAIALLPSLKRQCDLGWPGLSERERTEATNALWDLETAVLHLSSGR